MKLNIFNNVKDLFKMLKIGDIINDAVCPKDGIVVATIAAEKNDSYVLECSVCKLFFILQVSKKCPKCTNPMYSTYITVSSAMPHSPDFRQHSIFEVDPKLSPNSEKAWRCRFCGNIEPKSSIKLR